MTVVSARPQLARRLRRVALTTGTAPSAAILAAYLILVARMEGQARVAVQVTLTRGDRSKTVIVEYDVDERTAWVDHVNAAQFLLTGGGGAGTGEPVGVLRLADHDDVGAAHFRGDGRAALLRDDDGSVLASVPAASTRALGVSALEDRLTALLDTLTDDVNSRPVEADALTAAQRRLVLGEWNETTRDYPTGQPMQAAFEEHAARSADAVAVVQGEDTVTYRALNARAEHWARRLAAAGAGPERIVGVHLRRSAELVAVMLGILKTGAAYVPLDPEYPDDRLRFMATDADLVAVVSEQVTDGLSDVPVLLPGERAPDSRPQPAFSPAGTAYVLYTSGSSGRPKGVAITHANATDLLFWSAEIFGQDLSRVLATTSICFDCSILEIFGPLSTGGTVVLADGALAVGSVSVGHDVTLLHTVPSVMAELMAIGLLPQSVTTVLLGGEAPWLSLVDDVYRGTGVRQLLNVYGPTECTSYASTAVITAGSAGTPPIGRPVANTQVRLFDRYGSLSTVGAPGEIHIGGLGVARGYLHRPGLTAQRFAPDPYGRAARVYRTGDLARQDPAGELTFLGRADEQVKVRGVRVEPAEVEQALLRHPSVLEAVVWAPVEGPGRVRLRCVVVLATGKSETPQALREFTAGVLPAAMVPDTIQIIPRLPRIPNGKIDRALLSTLYSDASDQPEEASGSACAETPFIGPQGALEELVATTWAEALRLPRLGRHDDFYANGGHSLSAMRIRARLGDELGLEIPVPLVFQLRTVAELADSLRPLITAASTTTGASPSVAGSGPSDDGDRILSPNQRSVLTRMDAGPDPTMNLPLCVRLRGKFNPPALALALNEMVRQHEILRTTVKDATTGWLNPAEPVRMPIVDLTGLPVELAEQCAEASAIAVARSPFDLSRSPVLHAVLFRLGADDHVVSVVLHQWGGDVWSMEGVGRKLITLYRAATTMARPELPEPEVQYADWARDQLDRLATAHGQADREWWHKKLASLPTLSLPLHGPRLPAAQSTSHARDFRLEPAMLEELTILGRRHGATLYMVLLAAFRLRLGTWSGQSDIGIGCPTTGRPHPKLFTTIGPFVNAIVMRTKIDDDPTFRQLLLRVRDTALSGYAHEDTPFAQLVRDLDADRDCSRHPLYQASIALHYPNQLVPPPAGLDVDDFGQRPEPHTSLDVDLTIYVDGSGATAALTYRTDLFEDADADDFAAGFATLLAAVSRDPDLPISGYEVGTSLA